MSERQHPDHSFPKSLPYISASNPSAACVYELGTEEEKTEDKERESECSKRLLHSETELKLVGATGETQERFTDVRIGRYAKSR